MASGEVAAKGRRNGHGRGQRKAQGHTRRRNGEVLQPPQGKDIDEQTRIRRLWASQPDPDHPLTEEEREEKPAATGYDEWAHLDQELVGDDFGPGSRRRRAGLASRATVRTSSFAPQLLPFRIVRHLRATCLVSFSCSPSASAGRLRKGDSARGGRAADCCLAKLERTSISVGGGPAVSKRKAPRP